MDHGTPDLFGHVPSSKPAKLKKDKAAVIKPAAERYFVVYAPSRRPFYVLSVSIFAFVLWYVFGAQLTDIMPFDMKELPGPIYGALTFLGLIVGCIWLCADLAAASSAYFCSGSERRIYGRYRSRWKAYWLRFSIPMGCVSLVLLASLLSLHGYWNARTVAIVVSSRLLQPPRLAEEQISSAPALSSAAMATGAKPGSPSPPRLSEKNVVGASPPPRAAVPADVEPVAPQLPLGGKLASPMETGSVLPTRIKKGLKTAAVKEVDPLSSSIKEICDWFERAFGPSTK